MFRFHSRRGFLKKAIAVILCSALGRRFSAFAGVRPRKELKEVQSHVYRAVNGGPGRNIEKLIELMGGVETIIGDSDIVLIKPNVQWWNQGCPNLLAVYTFIQLIMKRPGGFHGEVIIAENCHRGREPSNSGGWGADFERNASMAGVANYKELTAKIKSEFGDRFSVIHWIDVKYGANRVCSPHDGVGYVYCDGSNGAPLLSMDNGLAGENRRSVIMTYPIFKTDRGTIVDFKNGVWKDGRYTDQPLRFINFAALNHHSEYCGATSALKNYLGVTDLSGGPDPYSDGKLTGDFYNFHSFPFDKWSSGPRPGMIGAEIGFFMRTIRKADLNITSAEWTGLASRTELPAAKTRAVLASTDPVALDYHATKYILYPNSSIAFHDPDNLQGPLYHDLKRCSEATGDAFDESRVEIVSWDFSKSRRQRDDELVIKGECDWGGNARTLLKYALFRWFPGIAKFF